MPLKVTSKPLGLDDVPPDNNDETLRSPRRFLPLPGRATLLAYGGDDGVITARIQDSRGDEFKVMHCYDDMVRAVAVSADGKRLVVGCDDGSTMIYALDDWDSASGGDVHPFCQKLETKNDENDNDDDDDDMLLSQDFSSASASGLKSFAGPKFELPIRDLQFVASPADDKTSAAYWLAIASEAGLVLVNVTSSSTLLERALEHPVQEHHSHSGIRGVAVQKQFLATLAMDGRLCVWDTEKKMLVEREATTCIAKKDVGEIHGADAFDRSCRPVLYPLSEETGTYVLATPGRLIPALRLLDTSTEGKPKLQTLEMENIKEDQGHLEPIVCIAFLESNYDAQTDRARYFVTCGRDARVILWKWDQVEHTKMTPLETFTLPCPPTDLLVQGSDVLAACADGTYSVIDLSPHLPASKKSLSSSKTYSSVATGKVDASTDDSPEKIPGTTKPQKKTLKTKHPSDLEDDDDSDVDFSEPASSTAGNTNRVRFVDDEAAEDDGENDKGQDPTKETNKKNPKSEQANKSNSSSPFDDNDDDEDSLADHRPAKKTLDDLDDAMADLDEDMPAYRPMTSRTEPAVPPQPVFSPSSTPLDLARRFLCWNHVGAITILHGDDRNTVDISFTDSAYKRPISFTDNMNFILGSLGEDGGIFATDLQMDDDDDGSLDGLDDLNMSESTKLAVRKSQKKGSNKATGSAIFFYRFETIGSLREKDWYLTLPVGERVWGAATGAGWAAVATSRKFLRFFSAGGNQGQLVWLKGDPVTMAGRGRFLAVVYHDASPLADGTQQLAYTLWDASNFDVISQGPVSCLSKGASLTWLGFSNDSSLMAMDSEGMLSMLSQAGTASWEWVPVLDTIGLRKSMDDQFWPITVFDGKMVCVPLKGGNTYPDAARRPVTSTLGLRLPLAGSGGKK